VAVGVVQQPRSRARPGSKLPGESAHDR
jgi:hypothetical protein